jgi:ribosomal protein S11
MKILVVKSSDGDVYFRADRNAYHVAAAEFAAQQVCVNDTARWSADDIVAVRSQVEARDYKALESVLVKIGAIREQTLRSE